MARLTPRERAKLLEAISELSDDDLNALKYYWPAWADVSQMPPPGDWLIWLFIGGRGAGKTRTGAEFIIERARNGFGPIALVSGTISDVRRVMIEEGPSSIMECSPPDFVPLYEPSKGHKLTWPNGCVAFGFSAEEPGQLRGPQFRTAWADEVGKWKRTVRDEAWSNLRFSTRLKPDPRIIATTTPLPIPLIKELVEDAKIVKTKRATAANEDNLSQQFIEDIYAKYQGTRLGRQELLGELLGDVPGALWTTQILDNCKTDQLPREFSRIVVAIDPNNEDDIEETAEHNEVGIIVAGEIAGGRKNAERFMILADYSLDAGPTISAQRALRAYDDFQADLIVVEGNQGGAAYKALLKTLAPAIKVKILHARRGKHVRAEPISSLYEQGRVDHYVPANDPDRYNLLEDQLKLFTTVEYQGDRSPDRGDALVWALTELALGEKQSASAGGNIRRAGKWSNVQPSKGAKAVITG